ncbi:MAG TPA: undecaprenyl-diphosphate phosphatase [Lachnospiraceae bacterium]|nr:undecaprenyl-diphosphate phosphatase [Lachnospiraceae bacterium]
MLEIIKVIIIGIIEGITEWLPISSTGHMILAEQFLKLNVRQEFWEMFLVVIQFGAIMAVIVLYFPRLWPFHRVDSRESGAYKVISRKKLDMWLKILVSCLPAVILGLPLDNWLQEHFYNYLTVAVMLIAYGIFFILVENRNRRLTPTMRAIRQIDWKTALLIGCFQVLALIPGTSRSGATILGGIVLGMTRKTASEYTFFLAVPVMLGASLLKLFKFGFHFQGMEAAYLIIGMVVAFFVSIFAIKFLMKYIRNHDFKAFGWYRIILGAIVILYFVITSAVA